MIRLTIITPVFNGSRYVQKCLENVSSQWVPGVEHLVMDGGSSDGTAELVRQFAEKHAHVRLISEKDRGQSDAMNKGIREAKGAIIGFLNVDDYYEPGVLARILDIFEPLPDPSFVCGNLNIWEADGQLRHFNRPNRLSLPELVSNCFEWPYNPSAYFYHKSLHERTGLYEVDNHLQMDYEFLLRAAREIPLRHVDELWGNFYIAEESKTRQSFTEGVAKSAEFAEALREKMRATFSEPESAELAAILRAQAPLYPPSSPKQALPGRILNKIKGLFRG